MRCDMPKVTDFILIIFSKKHICHSNVSMYKWVVSLVKIRQSLKDIADTSHDLDFLQCKRW